MATISSADEREQEMQNDLNKGKDLMQKGKNLKDKIGGNDKKGKKDKKDKGSDDKKKNAGDKGGAGKTQKGKGAGDAAKAIKNAADNPAKKAQEAIQTTQEVARAAAGDPVAMAKTGVKAAKVIADTANKSGGEGGGLSNDGLMGIITATLGVFFVIIGFFMLPFLALGFIVMKIASFFANILHLNDGVNFDEMTREEQYEYLAELIHDKVKESYDTMIEEWQDDVDQLNNNPQFNEFGIAIARDYNENEDVKTIQNVIDENEKDPNKPLRFGSGHDEETIKKSHSDWALDTSTYRSPAYYPIGIHNLINDKDDEGNLYGDGSNYWPLGSRYKAHFEELLEYGKTTKGSGYYKGHNTGKDSSGNYKGNYLKGDEPVVDIVKSRGSMNDQSNNGAIQDMATLVAAYNVARCDMPLSESDSWVVSTFNSYSWDIGRGTFWKDIGQFIGAYNYFDYEAEAHTIPKKTLTVTIKDSAGNVLNPSNLEYTEDKKTIRAKSGPEPATAEAANADGTTENIELNDIYLDGSTAYAHARTVLEYKEHLWLDEVSQKIYNYQLVATPTAIDNTLDRNGLANPLYSQEKSLNAVSKNFDVKTLDLSNSSSSGYYLNRDFDGHDITDTYNGNKIRIEGTRWDNFIPKYKSTIMHTPAETTDASTNTVNKNHSGITCILPACVPEYYNAGTADIASGAGDKIVNIMWNNSDTYKCTLSDKRYTPIAGSTKLLDEYKNTSSIGTDYKGNVLSGYKDGDVIWGYNGIKETSTTKEQEWNGYYTSVPSGYQNATANNPYKLTSIKGYKTSEDAQVAISSAEHIDKFEKNNYYWQTKANGHDLDTIAMEVKPSDKTAPTSFNATNIWFTGSYNINDKASFVYNNETYYLSYEYTGFDTNGNAINPRFVVVKRETTPAKDSNGTELPYQIYTFTNLYVKHRKITKTVFDSIVCKHKYQKYELKDYGIHIDFSVNHPTTDEDYNTNFVKKNIKKSFNHSEYVYKKYAYDYSYLEASSDPFNESGLIKVFFEKGGWYDDDIYEYSTPGFLDENEHMHETERNKPIDILYPDAPKDSSGRPYLEASWDAEYGIKKFPYRGSITMFQYACDEDPDNCAMGTKATCTADDEYNTLVIRGNDDGHWAEFDACGCGAKTIQENDNEKSSDMDYGRTQVIQSPYAQIRIIKKQGKKELVEEAVVQTVDDVWQENIENIKNSLDNYEEVQSEASNGSSSPSNASSHYEGGTDLAIYAVSIIMKQETSDGYMGLNPCDPNTLSGTPSHGSISVGKIQYNADGARDLIKQLIDADKEQAKKYWATYSKNKDYKDNLFFTQKTPNGESSWNHTSPNKHTVCEHTIPDYESFAKALKKLLNTKKSKELQDKAIIDRVEGYINHINKKWGITDPASLVWLADIENQYGAGGIENHWGSMIQSVVSAAGGGDKVTLKDLWKAYNKGTANKQYKTRRKTVYDALIADQKSGKIPSSMTASNGSGYGEGGGSGSGSQMTFNGQSTSIKVTYYNQADNWGAYGGSTMKKSGCCPSSIAIVLATYGKQVNGATANPSNVGKWCSSNGYYVLNQGTMHQCVPAALKNFGVKTTQPKSKSDVISALQAGKLIVCCMGPGTFTSGGHFICLAGVTKSGNILVADCGSRQRTANKSGFSLNTIWSEVKKCHGTVDMWIAER